MKTAKSKRAWMVGWSFGARSTILFEHKRDAESVAHHYNCPPKIVRVEVRRISP